MIKRLLSFAFISTLFFSCTKEEGLAGKFEGDEKLFFKGQAKTWVTLNSDGKPEQLVISMNDAALNSLPTSGAETMLKLPLNEAATTATPFQTVMVHWNPEGHEPAGLYDVPHFDFHFYMVGEKKLLAQPIQ